MQKVSRYSIALIILVGLVTLVANSSTSTPQGFFNSALEADKSTGRSGALSELTNFKWDEVCIFPPYSGLVDEQEKYEIIGAAPNSQDDGVWFILFKDNASKIAYSIRPAISPAKANFTCTKSKTVKFTFESDNDSLQNTHIKLLLQE